MQEETEPRPVQAAFDRGRAQGYHEGIVAARGRLQAMRAESWDGVVVATLEEFGRRLDSIERVPGEGRTGDR
jgi:hypothetical protein